MDAKPFLPLERPRIVGRTDLPQDLIRFYERNEGVGLESSHKRDIRLCRLPEIREYAWRDVPIFGGDDEPGWEDFRGLYIGVSPYHDGIYWVRKARAALRGRSSRSARTSPAREAGETMSWRGVSCCHRASTSGWPASSDTDGSSMAWAPGPYGISRTPNNPSCGRTIGR